MPAEDLSTNDIEMYGPPDTEDDSKFIKDDNSKIDYKHIDEIVKDCQKLYAETDQFVLWVLACDYYLKEELKTDIKVKEEYEDIYEKCKAEFKRTKEYTGVNVITDVSE
jgi:hypothetical protein